MLLVAIGVGAGADNSPRGTGAADDQTARVPILVYHRVCCINECATRTDAALTVAPEDFERQMEWLKARGYTPVGFGDLLASFDSGVALPERAVVITFDDGWATDASEALPVLKRLEFRATFFVFAGGVGTPRRLTWEQAREMVAAGMDVQSHTVSHSSLPGLDDARALEELAASRERIEHETGREVSVLAYPFGDCDGRIEKLAERAGYLCAVTTESGVVQRAGERMRLRRVSIGFGDGLDVFEARLSGR